ncbi:OadG family protein [Thiocapsa roseopersicina]|uniref:Probable oxaloacetate decarboxylase gamma chain n=1 Tax=Thiocapsa roseopersicina TaxID=1058 RepID=A0A1H2Z1H5_THIRO|nr:OadG family transporter subunit [Thiocapsa roseopersicina]SDX10764.1 oxaloacetate decarboxylase, gamma subunit [Thiocapsa roseopersicina]
MDTVGTELVIEGLWLMVIGMTIVYAFLVLLVGVLTLMSKAVARWAPEEPLPAATAGGHALARTQDDKRLIAVIGAAIQAHRRRHRP